MAHKTFLRFLFLMVATATIAVCVRGFSYCVTPLHLRPFRSDYKTMKPSGRHSQELGVVGATMLTLGVTMYSTWKRVGALWSIGKISRWLEVHMFLCLLGPILVACRTTFKASSIAGITLWTMLSVAVSGIVGRFLCVQIPWDLNGAEFTDAQICEEQQCLGSTLSSSPLGLRLVREIDHALATLPVADSFLRAHGTLSVIMFITLTAHVTVTLLLGYTWIF